MLHAAIPEFSTSSLTVRSSAGQDFVRHLTLSKFDDIHTSCRSSDIRQLTDETAAYKRAMMEVDSDVKPVVSGLYC